MEYAVEMCGITKYFGNVPANDNVDFKLSKGEIHALLGENGAGKSTLMNILYGIYSCDAGTIKVDGRELCIENPRVAIASGIGMVHQHFMQIPQFTVTQNVFLGMPELPVILDMPKMRKRVKDANEQFGFNVDPDMCVWQLSVGVQQKVEILKVLIRDIRILILDEPTAVLTPSESDELFGTIKKLSAQGYSVILITHKMDEVMKHCDTVTVMRMGKVVDTVKAADTTKKQLANMMVGHDVFLGRRTTPQEPGDVLLNVQNIKVKNDKGLVAIDGLSFSLRAGEILGVAGVDGNGQTELGEALAGLRKIEEGDVTFHDGKPFTITPRAMMNRGLGHIPDDRHKKGLILPFTVKENLISGSQRMPKYSKKGFLDQKAIDQNADRLLEEFDVRPRDKEYIAGNLSGGNQQKVILARELDRNPDVLLAIQPTRGLDIGAIEFVQNKIIEARNNGKAILLISTDLDEIRELSDRIAVMYNGGFSGVLPPEATLEELGMLMAGGGSKEGGGDTESANQEFVQ